MQQLKSPPEQPFNAPHFEPEDWKAAYEDEFKRRKSLEGQVAAMGAKIKGLLETNTSARNALTRAKNTRYRNNDIRRAVAAQCVAAYISACEEEPETLADRAVEAADLLLIALDATDPGGQPGRGNRR